MNDKEQTEQDLKEFDEVFNAKTEGVKMCDEEKLLKPEQKERAWHLLYPCLEWGSENSRPILMDQSRLIVLVDKLLKQINKQNDSKRSKGISKQGKSIRI